MSNISTELTNFYGYTVMAVKGEDLDIGGCVLTAPGLTAYELAHKYEKTITLIADGNHIGFASIASAINYICMAERTSKIEEITWWGDREALYFLKLQYCIGGKHASQLLPDSNPKNKEVWPTNSAKRRYLSRCFGRKLPRSKFNYAIQVKPLNH